MREYCGAFAWVELLFSDRSLPVLDLELAVHKLGCEARIGSLWAFRRLSLVTGR